jgi:OOP family OmpA-OmpF porin
MRKSLSLPLFLVAATSGCAMLASSPPPPPDTVVFFQPQTAVLDAPALHIIASAAATAQAEPDAPISVTGAADTVGALKDNEKLSIARAQAVANTLEADGVAASRITVRGMGETAAPAPGMQFARRVLIHIGQ